MVIKILRLLRWAIYEHESIVTSMDPKSIFESVIALSIEYILSVERINMHKNFTGQSFVFLLLSTRDYKLRLSYSLLLFLCEKNYAGAS